MRCPRDQAEMTVQKHEAGFEVDYCATCGGQWLDKGELEAVKAKAERDFEVGWLVEPSELNVSFSKRNQEQFGAIDCPKCSQKMEITPYDNWSEIIIDVCPRGCGLWLDKNELWALQTYFERSLLTAENADKRAMWATLANAFGG